MRVLMEILTILCLIPQFDCRILGVGELPVLARGSYEEGLWLNILPQITKGEHYLECQSLQSKATKDQIIQVRDFLNDLHLKREEFRAENL